MNSSCSKTNKLVGFFSLDPRGYFFKFVKTRKIPDVNLKTTPFYPKLKKSFVPKLKILAVPDAAVVLAAFRSRFLKLHLVIQKNLKRVSSWKPET